MEDHNRKACPHCGAFLPESASFCPHCTHMVRPRKTIKFSVTHLWRKPAKWAAALVLLAVAALGIYFYLTPNTYDAYGELTYTDQDGTYQLLLSFRNDRFAPETETIQYVEKAKKYQILSRLFVNHVETGANAGQIFMQKVDRISTELIQPENSYSPMFCSQPEQWYSAEEAQHAFVNYTGLSSPTELLWTLRMENGDTIRLRQKILIEPVETYSFYPEDHSMETIEELQALVDQINKDIPLPDVVNLHLPAVTYDGSLVLSSRPINLYGTTDGDNHRTTFTNTVQIAAIDGPTPQFYGIDFTGSGDGTGVSAASRLQVENCTFRGWKTGVLAHGEAWINVVGCTFEDKSFGFHFNITGSNVESVLYNDNRFLRNGTAVRLENVPGDEMLNFQGTQFIGNSVDIDNCCKQSLEISQATFK